MTRSVLVILFLLAGPALAEGPEPDPAQGEAAFNACCALCHQSVEIVRPMIEGTTAEEKAAWLDARLERHGAPEADKRADLIAYLLAE